MHRKITGIETVIKMKEMAQAAVLYQENDSQLARIGKRLLKESLLRHGASLVCGRYTCAFRSASYQRYHMRQ